MPEIHPTWDAEKARAHLAQLNADADRAADIAEAFENGAESYRREEQHRRNQIAYCEQMFSEPTSATNPTPANPQRDTARETDQEASDGR